jgi:undecaprenyl-diphosphatase
MHDIFTAVTLGAVEGITEFLPISSTGHLIIVNQWLSFDPDFTKLFDIIVQLGSILAVVVLFWKKLWPSTVEIRNLWKKIIIAVVPALVLGALFGSAIQAKLFNPFVVACALVIGGIIMLYAEKKNISPSVLAPDGIGNGKAFKIGIMQCLALIPGTSRSAATIIGSLFLGVSRAAAVEFSFFLAIPTMVAASGYSLLKSRALLGGITGHEMLMLVIGFIVSFAVALYVVRIFMNYIQTKSFTPFAWYRIVLGILILIFLR